MIASILIHLDFLSISEEEEASKKLQEGFNPYSPGFSIYLVNEKEIKELDRVLQSLFTWIFYLFKKDGSLEQGVEMLQSLFTWIFYLFKNIKIRSDKNGSASILIHLDFLSI